MTQRLIALNARQTREQTRAFVKECPIQEYDNTTSAEKVRQLARRINATTDEEEQRKLKGYLPFRCPHYTRFRDDYRDRDHIVPESFTWQTCVDIDDAELVERANKMSSVIDTEEGGQWQGMMIHKEYSIRRKLHIDIRLPLGMTVPEAQRAYCKALGVNPDTSCFTPERFIYLSPADFEIYRSEGWYEQLSEEEVAKRRKAYTDRGLSIDGRTEDGSFYDSLSPDPSPKGEGSGNPQEQVQSQTQVAELSTPLPLGEGSGERIPSFRGIPYATIIAEYWRRMGGEPQEGERNDKLHQLAANLRAICDNREDWLLELMPCYGLAEQEMRSIIHSACKEPTKGSRLMRQIVSSLEQGISSEEAGAAEDSDNRTFQHPLLRRGLGRLLPIGLKESIVGVPASMHMPVICGVLPLAAAYADQVEVEYCDGQRQHLGLMSIIRGDQASGKSVVKNAVDIWKRQLDEEDAIARRREEEWKNRKKGRKANEKAPEDPHVLVRVLPVTVSCSTLLKRFKNAQGHILYSFGEELDTLRKTNGAGSWSSKYDIYRLSFDRGEWGQDYNSDQAESGVVKVAYNWTMLGTNGAMRKCFRQDNIENGLSSRILVAEMPDSSFQKMPKFARRSVDDEARIQQAVTRLRSCSGLVDTPRLRKAIEQWVEQKRVEAQKDIDRVKDTYRKRAAVIGFRCGVIFHLLEKAPLMSPQGGKPQSAAGSSPKGKVRRGQESKRSIDFALMMAEYCLQQQILAFGEALRSEYVDASQECQRYGSNHSIFDQLPTVFSLEDLSAMKRSDLPRNSIVKIISRWKHDGWIEKVADNRWRKNDNDK